MNMMVSASALAAAAIPSPASAVSQADAELISLGRQLDAALVEWSAYVRKNAAEQKLLEAEITRATGMTHEEAHEKFDTTGLHFYSEATGELGRYFQMRHEICDRHCGQYYSDEEFNAMHDRIHPVAVSIIERPATSLVGLAVKARASMYINSEWWLDRSGEKAGGERELVALCEDICAVAGVPIVDGLADDSETSPVVARSARVTPSEATTGDPIFAAIDAHRRSRAHFEARCSDLADVETREAKDEWKILWDAQHSDGVDLLNIQPTTKAGVIALMRYAAEAEEGALPEGLENADGSPCGPFLAELHQHLANALEEM